MGNKNLETDPHAIILIDGVCHLCHGLTRFIVRRDSAGYFHFASLQSEVGQSLLERGGLQGDDAGETMVLVEGGSYYTRSQAALRIARKLRFPWPLAYALIVVPRPIRDRAYRLVAKNRYRWFGRSETCMVPTPDVRRRFLS